MSFYIDEFILGLSHRISKRAEEIKDEHPINSSIFPVSEHQTTWKFAKGKHKLHLHDGNVIHQFDLPEGLKDDEDFPLTKIEDLSYFDFGKDTEHTGTAQVHKSDPGMIYITMHDGAKNPTLTIRHVNENSWRASPKINGNHKKADINISEFEQGMRDKLGEGIMDSVIRGADTVGNYASDGLRWFGKSPGLSAGIGLGLGAAYDLGKRNFYNTDQENEEETGTERAMRYAIPTAGLGLGGLAMNSLTPQYYNMSPTYNSTNPASHRIDK